MPVRNFLNRSLKVLAKKYPRAFLKVALGSIENLVLETIENPEINLPERRLDFVYGLQDEEQEYLLHLEFQLRHEKDLPQRMHIYNAFLTASSNKPVISKVIYLERKNYRYLPQEYVVNYQDKRENVFTYEAIKLYFSKEFLLKFFKEEVEMLREASIVQDWINEGAAEFFPWHLSQQL